MLKKTLLIALALACPLTALAATDPITARKEVFKQYKETVGPMGKMVKGDMPYNKDEFAKLATRLDTLAQQPWQHFTPGSDKGKTDAKAEIWSKPAEFKQAVDTHKAEVAKLRQVAATGNLDQIRPQFGAVQKTCKACHDSFRSE
ncbi:c-type cytochrome [Gulbenkiania mobilis]|uniref:Cytochrome c556 n=1 Tax=Gulbenkiania mobilis TaxID=397457 RepID=A0ABY2CWC4_GULMO|nr:cytochrome c556 [Gulbenkiania mobilis]